VFTNHLAMSKLSLLQRR